MRAAGLFIFLCAGATIARADDADELTARAKYVQAHANSAVAQESYAEFLSDHGRLRDAILHWRIAELLDPENAAIANSLGGAYLRAGHAAQSAEQFQRAVAQAGNNAAYHYNLANVEYMLRRDLVGAWHIDAAALLQKALAEFHAAASLSPNDLEYARAYAETFYGMPAPDWTEAKKAWRRVLALSADRDFARLNLARISLKLGQKKEALDFLAQITDPRHDALKEKLRAQADQ